MFKKRPSSFFAHLEPNHGFESICIHVFQRLCLDLGIFPNALLMTPLAAGIEEACPQGGRGAARVARRRL
jgi:hypothetical protein